jgi:hypothetical protein
MSNDLEKLKKLYKICPRCQQDLQFLTNCFDDVVIMCSKKACEFAIIREGAYTFMSSG